MCPKESLNTLRQSSIPKDNHTRAQTGRDTLDPSQGTHLLHDWPETPVAGRKKDVYQIHIKHSASNRSATTGDRQKNPIRQLTPCIATNMHSCLGGWSKCIGVLSFAVSQILVENSLSPSPGFEGHFTLVFKSLHNVTPPPVCTTEHLDIKGSTAWANCCASGNGWQWPI